jgi:hypothetical protein
MPSKLIDKQHPTAKEYENNKKLHKEAPYKGHVQTSMVCSRQNDFATVELTNSQFVGCDWGVTEKEKIPNLVHYDVRDEGETYDWLAELGLKVKWIEEGKEIGKVNP